MSITVSDALAAASSRVSEVKEHKRQKYVCTAVSPYTRRDGTQSALLVWESRCAECGEVFTFKTPNGEKFEPNRRCQEHRRPGFTPKVADTAALLQVQG